ncbi:MAG: hypothetical protein JWN53_1332 [Gemmatimonadetes bacterium]|jgi:hypothetical protein|nr:hypothetical protein [Gemmatimonadota bacterium]
MSDHDCFRAAALLVALVAVAPARAQSSGAGTHRLTLGIGLLRSSEREASASPLLYSGGGIDFLAAYSYERPTSRTEVRAYGSAYEMAPGRTSSLSLNAGEERVTLQLAHLRRMHAWGSERWQLFGGLALMSSVAHRTQHLTNGEARSYLSYVVSGAPALRMEVAPSPSRTVTYQLAVPLVSGVTHPYSDINLLADPSNRRLTLTGPVGYREVEQTLSFTAPLTSWAGIRTTMLLDLYAKSGDPQLAGSRGTVSVALMLWTRGSARDARP